jgi:hypothetical protein
MKKTLVMFIPVVVLLCVAATRVGLFLPVLQSNMDGNGFSGTNFNTLSATEILLNGTALDNGTNATPYRAGTTNIANLATTVNVVFSSPFSQTVSSNYAVTFGFEGTVGSAAALSATTKTTNGFTANIVGLTSGATIDFVATPYK